MASFVNRHEWLKRVAADADLPERASTIAIGLWRRGNDETGRIDPGMGQIAKDLNRSIDTVRRGIRDLAKAGWLTRTEGRGAGNKTEYTLLIPGDVIKSERPNKGFEQRSNGGAKGNSAASFNARKKVAAPQRKGSSAACSYNGDKQSLEQKARAQPSSCPVNHCALIKPGSPNEADWNDWLSEPHLPSVAELGVRLESG